MKFRKKPVVIEAIQYKGEVTQELIIFCPDLLVVALNDEGRVIKDLTVQIDTLEGNLKVSNGDWIIKGIKGEFYPCKPGIFELTYYKEEDNECCRSLLKSSGIKDDEKVFCGKCNTCWEKKWRKI